MVSDKKADKKADKKDVVEINLSFLRKFGLGNVKKNVWVLATIVLALILAFTFLSGAGSGIGGDKAAGNLISFINSQGDSSVSLVSTSRNGDLYEVIISADGQQVPIFVTLDGEFAFLASDAIPITGTIPIGDGNSGTGDAGNSGEIGSVEIGDSPVKGQETAEIEIIEFSDYECPFCARFFDNTLGLIETNYIDTGKVKFAYKDFPLNSIHPNAQKAAEAARCVRDVKGDSGYFKMHDLIFENQALGVGESNLKKWALQLGVNINSCLESGKHSAAVLADLSYGQQLGVSGTPGFFIGNKEKGYTLLSGAQPYSAFEQTIEGYLAR